MQDLVLVFKALTDETRLKIIKLLEQGELCVCDIVAALEMQQSRVSFHLGVLKEAGLLQDRKQGKWAHYRIHDGDVLRRMLILTTLEKVPESVMSKYMNRLAAFRKKRGAKLALQGSPVNAICCRKSGKETVWRC
jgi:ArsR family transcriptional regulator